MYYGNGFTHSDVYNMPTYLRRFYSNKLTDQLKKEQKERLIADFIAGMTDRYAINLHKKIK